MSKLLCLVVLTSLVVVLACSRARPALLLERGQDYGGVDDEKNEPRYQKDHEQAPKQVRHNHY